MQCFSHRQLSRIKEHAHTKEPADHVSELFVVILIGLVGTSGGLDDLRSLYSHVIDSCMA